MTKPEWDVEAASAMYNVEGWGGGYFAVNSAGNVICVIGEASGVPGNGTTSSPRSAGVRIGTIATDRGLELPAGKTSTMIAAAAAASSAEEHTTNQTSTRRRRRRVGGGSWRYRDIYRFGPSSAGTGALAG